MKMNLLPSILFMMFFSFIIQYYIMSLIMVNDITNIRNSLGKLYLSTIMAFLMGIVEVMMHDFYFGMLSLQYYIPLFVILGAFYYLYKSQYKINDKEYLNEMIEHHSMTLLTSDEILQKTTDDNVILLADSIIKGQQKEISIMKQMVQNMN
jgi:hypothetical protein